jgi:DNA repair exonuclease SbcCD ATPase subunit
MEEVCLKIISCRLENFASYKFLDFNFENQGLTLIQGATGSGKSTLCDAIPWVLFGRTAKDGSVDEVLSWGIEEITKGRVTIVLQEAFYIVITRTRGHRAKDNDLVFYNIACGVRSPETRGKDLNDTQKLINNLLGIDSALYLSGAYFHEFSQTAQFFITTAKNRRAICEQLVDLSLAKNLQTKLSEEKKVLTKTAESYGQKVQLYADRIQQLSKPNDYQKKSDNFEQDKMALESKIGAEIIKLTKQVKLKDYFINASSELNQVSIVLGKEVCPECGSKKNSHQHLKLAEMKFELTQEMRENDSVKEKIEQLQQRLKIESAKENIYGELIKKQERDLKEAEEKFNQFEDLQDLAELQLDDVEQLLDVVNDLRGVTIKNTIQQLEDKTNQLLSNHFDAEIKVLFEVADADKLDVTIMKDGNVCSYSQLSKGQRQLLKLTFGVSVMRVVQNHSGVSFNAIFLDESMDGMDDNFKLKTFRLLQELEKEYESVFVVEHNEAFKSMFSNKYTVELVNGASVIEQT